ncbi:aldo/keto reductase [Gemmobacter lutimaris]|uniref:Aldo/keto reductase n=1 Tax=Gemmobacter lutimaris TaxID=2306023 RepID=A0A398BSL2_9RHOB|nr:aldo/keto reductase [Gemmobacter lutimaris]RID92507.1 aldo/keto reductase [Gemmobacter lutimaris]
MQMRKLGSRGPMVSAIGLGAMSFGGIFGPTTETESLACLDAMVEAGINFIDTANIYGMGVSETVIGKWLASRRPDVVIATKASIVNGPPRSIDNSAGHLRTELEASLKRLGVERVDLFYIHRREQARPLDEVIGTLQSLEAEGKIGGYGLSEVAPETLRAAHAIHPCTAVQNEYSLWSRQPELGLIQECARLGTAFVAFSPLARGMLGATPLGLDQVQDGFRVQNPRFMDPNFSRNLARIAPFRDWCKARGWSVPAAALAWAMGAGDHVLPIPGTRRADRLREWLPLPALTTVDRAEIDTLLPAGFAAGDRYGDHQLLAIERYC